MTDTSVNSKAVAATDRLELAFGKLDALFSSSAANKVLAPSKLSATLIKLDNKAGDYIQFDGAGFKITSGNNLAEKFGNFANSLASLAGDPNTSLKSITFGTKAGIVAKLDLTAKEIKLTVGTEIVSIKGDFPTKLGQIYKVIKETTGLDSKTGFDPAKLKLLVLKPGAELSKFDIDSISLASNKVKLLDATFTDKVIKVTSGKVVVEAKGHFPDNAGDLYNALREMVTVNKPGSSTLFSFVKTIGATASLNKYDVDSISIKNGTKIVGSASFTTKAVSIQLGDYKLTATGTFPHSAADFAKLLIDIEAGRPITSVKLTSLKLIDLHDNSVLASASGTISSADAFNIIDAIDHSYTGINVIEGTSGADKIVGTAAHEFIIGGAGNDELRGGAGNDRLDGGAGNDTLYGDAGDDLLFGEAGNDKLYGGAGNDKLDGGAGNDLLDGGAGNDQLYGGLGADILIGGAGADTFIYKSIKESTLDAKGRDFINDFSQAQKDKINLSAIDANTKIAGDQAFNFVGTKAFTNKAGELRYEHKDGDTYVYGDVDGDGKADFAIVLDTTIKLVATDFIL
ncbi:calcium-binding protein [Devosia sp. 2618]|uniref:calcium-binding protein n=1 Tax=Devosia sp. 2618 TaxID=3156454 RepID=UPI00339957B5